jgi:hypothetical protein
MNSCYNGGGGENFIYVGQRQIVQPVIYFITCEKKDKWLIQASIGYTVIII